MWRNIRVESLTEFAESQRLQDQDSSLLGLLINFNEVLLKNGITRIINTPTEQV
jgi:hypothetical protein